MTLPKKQKYSHVPYECLYIDATWQDVLAAFPFTLEPGHHRSLLEYKLERLWNQESVQDPEQKSCRPPSPSSIIPCLSVRTALDLFLRVKGFPPGSEIIFSAVNIPSMASIVQHHGLKIVSLDVDIETLTPKVEDLESLITPKTVAILFAHIFGRWSNIDNLVTIAKENCLLIIEDCAESFCGLQNHGHPSADVSLFSFGVIKHSTAFGGAIAVVRDATLLSQMRTLYHTYPVQPRSTYLKKVLKYSLIMTLLNSPALIKYGKMVVNTLGIDGEEIIVRNIRAFPNALVDKIRMRPSVTLLYMLYRKLKNFDSTRYNLSNIKAEFVAKRLPQGTKGVGLEASQRNHWLFPIIVDDPERVVQELRSRGVDAYRGATQLDLIEPDVPVPPRLQASRNFSGNTLSSSCTQLDLIKPAVPVPPRLQTFRNSSGTTLSSSCTRERVEQKNGQDLSHETSSMGRIHPPAQKSTCTSLHDSSHRSADGLFSNGVDSCSRSKNEAEKGEGHVSRLCRQTHTTDATRKVSEFVLPSPSSPSEGFSYASNGCRMKDYVSQQELMNLPPLDNPLGLAEYSGNSKAISDSSTVLPLSRTCRWSSCSNTSEDVQRGSHGQGCNPIRSHDGDATAVCHQVSCTCEQHEKHKLANPVMSPSTFPESQKPVGHSLPLPQSAPPPSLRGLGLSNPPAKRVSPLPSEDAVPSPNVGALPSSNEGAHASSDEGAVPHLPLKGGPSSRCRYPSDARYLMNHIVYLPVHKLVSFHYLEQICTVLEDTMEALGREKTGSSSGSSEAHKTRVRVESKL